MHYAQNSTQQSAPSVAQALALTRDNNSYQRSSSSSDNNIEFRDIMEKEYRAQEARDAYAADAQARKESLKEANRKEAQESADRKEALRKNEDTAETNKADTSRERDDIEVSADDKVPYDNDNKVENSVSIASNPLQSQQLPQNVQDLLDSLEQAVSAQPQTQSLTVDPAAFEELSDLQKLQFLSVMNSLQVDGSGEISALTDVGNIEGFMNKLAQQFAQQDPSATLNNLTPQQITDIQDYISYQAQSTQKSDAARAMLDSILALQNIDPKTALSNGGPAGVHAGLDRQDIINGALNGAILDEIASVLSGIAKLVQPDQGAAGRSAAQASVSSATPNTATNNATANILSEPALLSDMGLEGDMDVDSFNKLISRFTSMDGQDYAPTAMTRQQALAAQNQAVQSNTAQTAQATPDNPQAQAAAASAAPPAIGALSVADSILQELGLSGTLVNNGSTQALGMTSTITSTQNAGHSHPASQMVAATLHKSAAQGESKAITIRLDPPELGRVEIKMSFEQNSKIKAVLTMEKPETQMMMQRDAQMLEKALQDAGFDTDGSLSFELAQDGHDFGQDGSHDQFHHNAKGEQLAEEDVDIIDTTMTWSVNAQTGHVSYNIMA